MDIALYEGCKPAEPQRCQRWHRHSIDSYEFDDLKQAMVALPSLFA